MNLRVPIFPSRSFFFFVLTIAFVRRIGKGETRQRLQLPTCWSSCNHDDCSYFTREIERVRELLLSLLPLGGRYLEGDIRASAYYRRSVVYDRCGWMDELLWSARTGDEVMNING